MTPGRPGRATTATELRWICTAWLGAFLLKMLGSSWDVSGHFMWLRDDLAPPRLLDTAGTAVVVLVLFHNYSGHGVINGLDITSCSPSHALLHHPGPARMGGGIAVAAAVPLEALGLLPPWNWWSALPVTAGFAASWAAVDAVAGGAWSTRWRSADEPAVPEHVLA